MFPPPPAPAPVVAAAPSAADGPTEAVEDVPSALQPATTTITAVDEGLGSAEECKIEQPAAAVTGGGPVIVFDWDCTVTSQHLYKILAGWPPYCEPFSEWCDAQGIPDPIKTPMRGSIVERMSFGGGDEGDALLRRAVREFMMGGEARIAALKELLVELRTVHGCTLCVLTRGETSSLRIIFDKVLPDWAPLFEGGWIANTANEYFTCGASGALSEQRPGLTTGMRGASKESMLEQLYPFTEHTVMLVDDSITRGSHTVSSTAPGDSGGVIHLLDLPLEAHGLDDASMAKLREVVGCEGGLVERARANTAAQLAAQCPDIEELQGKIEEKQATKAMLEEMGEDATQLDSEIAALRLRIQQGKAVAEGDAQPAMR